MAEGQELRLQEELLSQTVTAEELPLLLQRLGEEEFHLSNDTSVRDIVEGTQSDPVKIGRALAEIRRQAFDERFAEAFSDHERRIQNLERKRPASSPTTTDTVRSAMRQIAKEQAIERDVRDKRQNRNALVVVLIAAFGLTYFAILNGIAGVFSGPGKVEIRGTNGARVVKVPDGTYYVVRPDGTRRPPSPDERKLVDAEAARVRGSK